MEKPYEIRKAHEHEVDSLMALWIEKVHDLARRGIRVWDIGQFSKSKLKEKYGEPEYYLGLLDGHIFGGFILLEKDIHPWPQAPGAEAYYFHKFVIASEFGGRGLSHEILKWVQDYGRQRGKRYIRLDFNEKRDYLKRLYYGNGFKPVGVLSENEADRIVLAERELA